VLSTTKRLGIQLGENGNMKANRKFRDGEEAVSAVIGVILMVAITVAIAATVYVYVSGMLGTGPTLNPTVSMIQTENYIHISGVENGPVVAADATISIKNSTGLTPTNVTGTLNAAGTNVAGGDTITISDPDGVLLSTETYIVNLIYGGNTIGTVNYSPTS
jgi:flagellin-like protein